VRDRAELARFRLLSHESCILIRPGGRPAPRKTAIFWGDDEYSYHRLDRQSSWLADHSSISLQVQPGDRVALWLRNRPEFVVALFAVLRAGAVVVPINNFLKAEEVASSCRMPDPRADHGIRIGAALPLALSNCRTRIPGCGELPHDPDQVEPTKSLCLRDWLPTSRSSFTPRAPRANPRAQC
jgi:hypothetical protein